jgi:hypothetical protein
MNTRTKFIKNKNSMSIVKSNYFDEKTKDRITMDLMNSINWNDVWYIEDLSQNNLSPIYSSKADMRKSALELIKNILIDVETEYVYSGRIKVEKVSEEDFFWYEIYYIAHTGASNMIDDNSNTIIWRRSRC